MRGEGHVESVIFVSIYASFYSESLFCGNPDVGARLLFNDRLHLCVHFLQSRTLDNSCWVTKKHHWVHRGDTSPVHFPSIKIVFLFLLWLQRLPVLQKRQSGYRSRQSRYLSEHQIKKGLCELWLGEGNQPVKYSVNSCSSLTALSKVFLACSSLKRLFISLQTQTRLTKSMYDQIKHFYRKLKPFEILPLKHQINIWKYRFFWKIFWELTGCFQRCLV